MTDTQTNTMITGTLSMEDFYANQPFEGIVCPNCGKTAKDFNNFTKTIVLECDKLVVKDKTLGIELTIPDISVFDSISINGIIYERKSK